MRSLVLLVAVALVAVGCGNNVVSSGSSGSTGGSGSTGSTASSGSGSTSTSGGSSGSSGTVQPRPTYPAGPYAVNIGHTISNYGFSGYVNNVPGQQDSVLTWGDFDLQKLRNLTDANGQPYRYMLFVLSAGWCVYCNQEADDYGVNGADSAKISQWLGQGGLYVTVLTQNYDENNPASPVQADIDQWKNAHVVQSTLGGDTTGQLLTSVSQSAYPASLVIRLDDMQILDAWYGQDQTKISTSWEATLAQ